MKYIIFGLLIVVGAMLWVRLSPSDPAKWHKAIEDPIDAVMPNGVMRVLDGKAGQYSQLETIISSTPRTKQIAVSAGMATFVTRSLLWGFPDYATVWTRGDDLVIYSRLRFGGGDMGVNAKRVDSWIAGLPTP